MSALFLAIFTFLVVFIGAAVGSFLNVVIWRVPAKMNLSTPPSHCPKCGARIRWYDNIPVASWFILGGKCRDCRAPISFRYPFVEFLSCFITFTVCFSIFFGGGSGLKSQCLQWEEFANLSRSADAFLQSDANSATRLTQLDPILRSFLVDDLVRLAFIGSLLAIFFTLLADSALMLGFVQYDGHIPPNSLVAAVFVILLLTIPMIMFLNSSETITRQLRQLASFVLGGGLGALILFFAGNRAGERTNSLLLGAILGVVSGYAVVLPAALLCLIISWVIRKKTGRNVSGIVVFLAIATILSCESAYFFYIRA